MELRDWIKAARKHGKLSGEALGEAIGRTKQNVSHWESGLHEPSVSQVKLIAQVTGFPLAPLFEGHEIPKLAQIRQQPSSVPPVREIKISGNLNTPEGRLLERLLLAAKSPGVNVEVKRWKQISGELGHGGKPPGQLGIPGLVKPAKKVIKKEKDEP